jgi:fatty acid desaturase
MATATAASLLRSGALPNTLAISYAAIGYFGGWWALFQSTLWLNAAGVLVLAHGMTIAAYLIHECAHNTLFRTPARNARLGRALGWLTGSSYGTFEDLRYKHMRHHVDNSDPISFDYRGWFAAHPRINRVVNALEWSWVPATEIVMHVMLVLVPFVFERKRDQRARVVQVALIRGAAFAAIAYVSVKAALLYLLAYLLFITVLRFMDAFQHNYEIHLTLDTPEAPAPFRGDRGYEERNTYSNLLSRRWSWLNLLVLNFNYHNAHHARPRVPWHELPTLHSRLYPGGCPQQLGFREQLRSFHKNRVARVLSLDYGSTDVRSAIVDGRLVGANGLSFLTAF